MTSVHMRGRDARLATVRFSVLGSCLYVLSSLHIFFLPFTSFLSSLFSFYLSLSFSLFPSFCLFLFFLSLLVAPLVRRAHEGTEALPSFVLALALALSLTHSLTLSHAPFFIFYHFQQRCTRSTQRDAHRFTSHTHHSGALPSECAQRQARHCQIIALIPEQILLSVVQRILSEVRISACGKWKGASEGFSHEDAAEVIVAIETLVGDST